MKRKVHFIERISKYEIYDFLEDHGFRAYILNSNLEEVDPDMPFDQDWKAAEEIFSESDSAFQKARSILIALQLHFGRKGLESNEIQRRIDQRINEYRSNVLISSRKSLLKRRSWLAAASLLLMIVAFFVVKWLSRPEILYQTGSGEQLKVELPDDTKVHLNGNSSLAWDRTWEKSGVRRVVLQGEGYFEVSRKDTKIPFEVEAKGVIIEVLGTIFNVNTRRNRTQVFLEEGKVNLKVKESNNVREMVLQPGEKAVYEGRSKTIGKVSSSAPEEEISWTEGLLIYRDEPLNNVLDAVSDIYGKEFVVDDPRLLDRRITTTIPLTNWKISASSIQLAMKLEFKQDRDTIRIIGKN